MARLIDRKDKETPKIEQVADTTRNIPQREKKQSASFSAKDRKNIKVNPDTMTKLEVIANNFFDKKIKQYELQDILVDYYIQNALETRQQKILRDLLKQF